MKDIEGVERGVCTQCDCPGFKYYSQVIPINCEYCGCFPAKHLRLEDGRGVVTLATVVNNNSLNAMSQQDSQASGCNIDMLMDIEMNDNVADISEAEENPPGNFEDSIHGQNVEDMFQDMSQPNSQNSDNLNSQNSDISMHTDIENDSDESRNSVIDSPAKNLRKRKSMKNIKIRTKFPTGSNVKRLKGLATLPKFSAEAIGYLKKSEMDMSKGWTVIINEAALYYVDMIGNTTDYHKVGDLMLLHYPKIADPGKSPHKTFRNKLSGRIRKLRMERRKAEAELLRTKSGNKVIAFYETRPVRAEEVVDGEEDATSWKDSMKKEFNKPKPSFTKMKQYILNTYDHRTQIIKAKQGLATILKPTVYPCLVIKSYFEVEAMRFFGSDNYAALRTNVSFLVAAIIEAENEQDHEFALVKAQARFGQDQIIVFASDFEDFTTFTQSKETDDAKLVIWREEEQDIDVVVTAAGYKFTDLKTIENGILMLISVVLVFGMKNPEDSPKFFKFLEAFCLGISAESLSDLQQKYILDLFDRCLKMNTNEEQSSQP